MLTMEELITIIKMKAISPTAMGNYKCAKADLVAIDDIMLFPINKEDAAGFFNLINTMYEQTSIIITTNKSQLNGLRLWMMKSSFCSSRQIAL